MTSSSTARTCVCLYPPLVHLPRATAGQTPYRPWGAPSVEVGLTAAMSNRWYKQAVIYSLEVDTYQDSDGDGCGDFQGLVSRLDYLSRLGVTCLWLNPIHPSPMRDAGYDVSDYYGVDPRLGSLGDVVELFREAEERGIR